MHITIFLDNVLEQIIPKTNITIETSGIGGRDVIPG